jgi:hypothetical protein
LRAVESTTGRRRENREDSLTLHNISLANTCHLPSTDSKQRKVRVGLAAVIKMEMRLVTITSVEEGGGGRGHPDLDSPQQQGKGEGGGKAKDRVETRGGAGPGPGPGPGPVPQGNCITIGFLIATPTQAAATAVEQTLADPTFAAKVGESSVLSALPCFTCSSTSCPALHCSPPPLPAPLLLLFLLHHLCFPHHGTTFQTPPAPPPPPHVADPTIS